MLKLNFPMVSLLERVVESCGSVAVVGVGVGVGALESAVSVILRVREEYGVKCAVLLYTSRTVSTVSRLLELFREFSNVVRLYPCSVACEEPGCLEAWLRKEVVEFLGEKLGRSNVVVVPTPGSRRMAAALGMASGGSVDVVHVDFYWGLWSGLTYPLVPRILEPLYILNPVHGRPRDVEPVDKGSLKELGRRLLEGLPPLRRRVGELALLLNVQSIGSRVAYSRDGVSCDRVVVTVKVGVFGEQFEVVVGDWCSFRDWVRAANRLREKLVEFSGNGECGELYRFLIRASGLERIVLGREPLRGAEKPVVIDTNLVYWGSHNDCWEGARILVPYAVQAEVLKRCAEAFKKPRLDRPCQAERMAMDLLAYHQLLELLHCNQQTVIPSPPPPADTAIPSIDPLLLTGKIIATGDHGAYELWKNHPFSKIAEPKLATTTPLDEKEYADTVYAILQLAALTQILPQQLQNTVKVKITVHAEPYKI